MKLLKYYNLKIIILILGLIITNNIYGQDKNDNSIKTATLLSIACPGLGQIYNKKYWKTPIIYTGLGISIYYYIYNHNKYHEYKNQYNLLLNDKTTNLTVDGYTKSNLITLQSYYRDSRDLSGLLFLLIYCLNIIDASVDSHLMNYNITDNLSLDLKPYQIDHNETIHLCLTLNL